MDTTTADANETSERRSTWETPLPPAGIRPKTRDALKAVYRECAVPSGDR